MLQPMFDDLDLILFSFDFEDDPERSCLDISRAFYLSINSVATYSHVKSDISLDEEGQR